MARQPKATPDVPPWVSLTPELYSETIDQLVTFSHKTTNSNIPAGGVRLAADQALRLPYVSARTLLATGETPDLDYIANSGKVATAVKQLRQLQDGTSTAPADEALHLLAKLTDGARQGCEIGTERVSLRARQLLLPRPDGSYVAITPLSAGGVSRSIRSAVRAHNDTLRNPGETDTSTLQRISTAVFGLGGAKPLNVGSLAREMQRPLVFFPPAERRQVKAALAQHFQGIPIRLPRALLKEFRDWCRAARARNGGHIPTDMHTRDEEAARIRQIVDAVLIQGEQARQRLLAHLDILPNGGSPLVSADADPIARGLIDRGLRDREWPRAFAIRLARLIADFRFGDEYGDFHFDQQDIYALQAITEDVVR